MSGRFAQPEWGHGSRGGVVVLSSSSSSPEAVSGGTVCFLSGYQESGLDLQAPGDVFSTNDQRRLYSSAHSSFERMEGKMQ